MFAGMFRKGCLESGSSKKGKGQMDSFFVNLSEFGFARSLSYMRSACCVSML